VVGGKKLPLGAENGGPLPAEPSESSEEMVHGDPGAGRSGSSKGTPPFIPRGPVNRVQADSPCSSAMKNGAAKSPEGVPVRAPEINPLELRNKVDVVNRNGGRPFSAPRSVAFAAVGRSKRNG